MCDAFSAMVRAGIAPLRFSCDDILCSGLDGSDLSSVNIKVPPPFTCSLPPVHIAVRVAQISPMLFSFSS